MFRNIEELQKFGKAQLEAATSTATNLSKSAQQIAVEATDYSKKTLEHTSATVEKLFGAKTLDSAIQIQSDYAKSAYEEYIAQVSKMGELYTNFAKEALKPVEGAFAQFQANSK